MPARIQMSAGEARRVSLAAQGFDRPRPSRNDVRQFRRVSAALGIVQLDFVNVLIPAHYLVLWSRLGAYDRGRFDRYVYDSGELTEQWAHEASIVPVSDWPHLAYRRAAWKPWRNNPILKLPDRDRYLARVLETVKVEGALTSRDLPVVTGPKRKAGDWHRSVPRSALEFHFGQGSLVVRDRLPNFQRVYDLPERVIPPQHLERQVGEHEARRALLKRAADAFGIATLTDLADYYRMSGSNAAPRIMELVDSGDLETVHVEGWDEPAYLSSRARIPRRIDGASLMSPFDPVLWCRPRALRLYGIHYRIEIYVPAARRKWGYYVLPFRLGENLVARVDLKADRHGGRLLVRRAHLETGFDAEPCASALAQELRALADWLDLERVCIERRSRFETQLRRQPCLKASVPH